MIKVSTTGMAVSLKTDLRFPISGQWGHGDRIIHSVFYIKFIFYFHIIVNSGNLLLVLKVYDIVFLKER